jgi:hypothetical protein
MEEFQIGNAAGLALGEEVTELEGIHPWTVPASGTSGRRQP